MSTKVVPGVLIAAPDADGVASEAAERMARAIVLALDARGKAFIALSGGSSPLEAYRRLAREPRIDWSLVEVFQVDERALPPSDPGCNWLHARESLVDRAKIPDAHAHPMRADAPDLASAALAYESILKERLPRDPTTGAPVFDLVVMGIGDDGHTASLFPGEASVGVTDRTVIAVPPSGSPKVARLTLTVPVLEAARSAVMIAIGKAKHAPLERAWLVAGSTRETPARVLRDVRGAVTWVIDRAAGGLD